MKLLVTGGSGNIEDYVVVNNIAQACRFSIS